MRGAQFELHALGQQRGACVAGAHFHRELKKFAHDSRRIHLKRLQALRLAAHSGGRLVTAAFFLFVQRRVDLVLQLANRLLVKRGLLHALATGLLLQNALLLLLLLEHRGDRLQCLERALLLRDLQRASRAHVLLHAALHLAVAVGELLAYCAQLTLELRAGVV